jgi:hypothetical protein
MEGLKWVLRNMMGKHGVVSSGKSQRQVAGCCEQGNEPSGSIKFGEFLTGWGTISFSRRTLLHGGCYVVSMSLHTLVALMMVSTVKLSLLTSQKHVGEWRSVSRCSWPWNQMKMSAWLRYSCRRQLLYSAGCRVGLDGLEKGLCKWQCTSLHMCDACGCT